MKDRSNYPTWVTRTEALEPPTPRTGRAERRFNARQEKKLLHHLAYLRLLQERRRRVLVRGAQHQ